MTATAKVKWQWSLQGAFGTPNSAQLVWDKGWSPYLQGTLILPSWPSDDIVEDNLDPRTYPEIRVTATNTNDDGSTTTLVDTGPIGGQGAVVRSAVQDLVTGQTTIKLASRECKLTDFARSGTTTLAMSTDLGTLVGQVIAIVDPGAAAPDAPGVFTLTNNANVWTPGTTAWDFLNAPLQAAGWQLYYECSNLATRGWKLVAPGDGGRRGGDGSVELQQGVNIISGTAGIDMDDGGWCDAAQINYSWTDAAGAQHVKYYGTGGPSYHKTFVEEFDAPDPGFDGSANLLGRSLGNVATPTVPLNVMAASLSGPPVPILPDMDATVWAGRLSGADFVVQSAQFNGPGNTIDLTLAQGATA